MTELQKFQETLIVDTVEVVDEREELLRVWIDESTPYAGCTLKLASADASFRRYFRLFTPKQTFIVMDAPPALESCHPFIEIGQWMYTAGIRVPKIHFVDLKLGFMILSDFGDVHYQEALLSEKRNQLYEFAIEEILQFQLKLKEMGQALPSFAPEWQIKELDIFREWCLPNIESTEYLAFIQPLIEEIEKIPKSFMHRDFHCRNLLVLTDGTPGIIDFQGAMNGPITYDLVSLLRDCYVDNSEDWIHQHVIQYRTKLIKNGIISPEIGENLFKKWFDWTGLQRHIKCLGIFHRLKLRDNKPKYLLDVPRVLRYARFVLNAYPELSDLKYLVEQAKISSHELSS